MHRQNQPSRHRRREIDYSKLTPQQLEVVLYREQMRGYDDALRYMERHNALSIVRDNQPGE